jgi:hypothetical protein
MAALVSTGGTTSFWARHRNKALLALVGLLAVFCYAPALRAYFVQDDFVLLAIARQLHQPLLLFFHDHFPGSLYFRPLGLLAWWLSAAVFDNAPRGHYALNLLLHLGTVAALYTLLQRLRRDAPLNTVWTAAYAVHPLAIGTSLWLSDRFDLIATAFSLLALSAAIGYVQRPAPRRLLSVLACILLAFMAKEIAIVGALAVCALIALPNRAWPLTARQRWPAVIAVVLLIAAWLGYRSAMLVNPQNLLLNTAPLITIFTKGITLWLRIGFEFLAEDPQRSAWMTLLLAVAALLLVVAIGMTARNQGWKPQAWGVAAALLVLVLLPGPTQAPIVSVSTTDLTIKTFWFDVIGYSRLYYLSLAGLIAGLMLLTTPVQLSGSGESRARRATIAAGAALVLMLAAWVPASHVLAHDFAKRSREQIAPLVAAHEAIARLELPAHRCQIYLLDTQSIWGMDNIGDATLKATSPTPARLEHCLLLTERAPWGNFMRAGSLAPGDYEPLRVLKYQGQPIPWLVLGDFEAAYLNLDSDIDARKIDGAFFLEYRNGAFVDVSAQVRDGTRPVQFYNARPDQN